MPRTTLTTKGQVTIPKPVRDVLRLRPGDRLDFIIGDDGRVLVRAGTASARELKGLLRRRGRRPVSLAAMEAATTRHHRARP
ncbi:MAG: AbrB/MazE/SpoVT family DNA-binding domain-containing protein [Candidatus Rokubacteria bacterium]|nr:AbrB/MazE/SpoVT family DNA-binding domain-containing protein [Candidatus Rokubacteria bacterium]